MDRYDKQNDSQLVHTLVTFLGNDENLSKTAQDLFAHRHTIRYRLQKIADITGSECVPERRQGAAEPGAQGAEPAHDLGRAPPPAWAYVLGSLIGTCSAVAAVCPLIAVAPALVRPRQGAAHGWL